MDAIAGNKQYLDYPTNLLIHQLARSTEDDRATVISGLSRRQKTLSPKYFYDQTGSELFDRITETSEYYPTRTEQAIFESNRAAMLPALHACDVLVEPGSGNGEKAIPILDAGGMAHYVPIEISTDFLMSACADLVKDAATLEAAYNPAQHRIEMHLVSGYDTRISIADQTFDLRAGETIHTENSYKYSCAGFRELAEQQGFEHRSPFAAFYSGNVAVTLIDSYQAAKSSISLSVRFLATTVIISCSR